MLVLGQNLLKVGAPHKLANLQRSYGDSILYRRILVCAWEAEKIEDYCEIIEVLLGLQSLTLLQSRFYFWQRELKRKCY